MRRLLPWVAVVVVISCGHPTAAPPAATPPTTRPADTTGEPSVTFANQPAVLFAPGSAQETRVRVQLAQTEEQRRRGLMYVQHLPLDDGMLFLFEDERVQSFWMKNTLIPLDMVFIAADMTVVGVVTAEPLSTRPRGVGVPSQFVLEVNAGWAAAHGVTAGTPVRFENVSRPASP